MNIGNVILKLDKEWDMEEMATLSKLYIQCYSLVFSLSDFALKTNDERAFDWFKGTYANYPWRGGFSAVNFYNSLYAKIPYEQRPIIIEIRYASPGHIKLKEAVLVAGMLAGIVAAITTSIDNVHDTYNKIQSGMSQRKLTKLEVNIKELQLKQEQMKFIRDSKKQLIEELEIPKLMQSELSRRSDENELMDLKILMSFYRRLEPLALLQGNEKLFLVNPNQNSSNNSNSADAEKTRG